MRLRFGAAGAERQFAPAALVGALLGGPSTSPLAAMLRRSVLFSFVVLLAVGGSVRANPEAQCEELLNACCLWRRSSLRRTGSSTHLVHQ